MTDQFPALPVGCEVGQLFRIERELSRAGAMAAIFLVSNLRTRHQVAMKIARSDDRKYSDILLNEIRILQNLRHPGIVHIYPIKVDDRIDYVRRANDIRHYFAAQQAPWYYTMEVLKGNSLEFNRKSGQLSQLPTAWKMELIYQLALILEYLHSHSIAHRDLSMNNIVFRAPPHPQRRPEPVLVDFGSAERSSVKPHLDAGTISHMPPERVEEFKRQQVNYSTTRTRNVDYRPSDVWALGVNAYELLVNQYPWNYNSENELVNQILYEPVTMPRNTPAPIAAIIQQIVIPMLAKVREDRLVISEVIRRIDMESPYPPPRLS